MISVYNVNAIVSVKDNSRLKKRADSFMKELARLRMELPFE